MNDQFEYDLALSFAGEDRQVAERLANILVQDGVRVFYDAYEQSVLWGKDLYQHLQHVYMDMARYCLIFVSSAYAAKVWTKHELKQAQARAIRERHEYILPVRIDDTEIPGLNATIGYIDLRQHAIEDLRYLVLQKLFGNDLDEDDLDELTWEGELIEFRGMEVASFWPKKLAREQARTSYVVRIPRIRYGDETRGGSSKKPCHDCAAVRGEYHSEGCDWEECPVCHGQAFGCKCILG